MRYAITHKTVYQYNTAVSVSHHLIRLKPRERSYQRLLSYQLSVDPAPELEDAHQDYFGNVMSFVTIEGPHRQLVVVSRCEVEVTAKPPPTLAATPTWEEVRELCRGDVHTSAGGACEFAFARAISEVPILFEDNSCLLSVEMLEFDVPQPVGTRL